MLKSDTNNLNDVLNSYEMISIRISGLLDSDENLDINKINDLKKLYDLKNRRIDSLKKYMDSDLLKFMTKNNITQIEDKLNSLVERDKNQISQIKFKTGELKTKLLKLSKQKSLLKYLKGYSI